MSCVFYSTDIVLEMWVFHRHHEPPLLDIWDTCYVWYTVCIPAAVYMLIPYYTGIRTYGTALVPRTYPVRKGAYYVRVFAARTTQTYHLSWMVFHRCEHVFSLRR